MCVCVIWICLHWYLMIYSLDLLLYWLVDWLINWLTGEIQIEMFDDIFFFISIEPAEHPVPGKHGPRSNGSRPHLVQWAKWLCRTWLSHPSHMLRQWQNADHEDRERWQYVLSNSTWMKYRKCCSNWNLIFISMKYIYSCFSFIDYHIIYFLFSRALSQCPFWLTLEWVCAPASGITMVMW